MQRIWKRIAFFAVANMLALTASAQALEVGQVIHFTSPFPMIIGCIEPELAEQAYHMRHRYADWQIEQFVNYNSFGFEDDQPHGCMVLNTRRSAEWKVVKQRASGAGNPFIAGWFCLQSTANFATGSARNESKEEPACFWTFLIDNGR